MSGKIAVISFTRQGSTVSERLLKGLAALGYEAAGYVKAEYAKAEYVKAEYAGAEQGGEASGRGLYLLEGSVREWTGQHFKTGGGLIFIGAAGIAVRAIAPFIEGKDRDPAVVVIDELGRFSVSLLSGHLGGANDLAGMAAAILGAVPVVTTATDLNKTFAVDLFAKKNDLKIDNPEAAKRVSAALLDGRQIGFFSDFSVAGEIPAGLVRDKKTGCGIWITVQSHAKTEAEGDILRLVPRAVMLGIGCRKGVSRETIEEAVQTVLAHNGVALEAIAGIGSIDLKKSEQGLLSFAQERKVEFTVFSPEELQSVKGEFTESEFVRRVTGVSNVCERAALCGWKTAAGPGRLIIKKTAVSGVTVAAAVKEMTFHF